jgi:hypothetical protein
MALFCVKLCGKGSCDYYKKYTQLYEAIDVALIGREWTSLKWSDNVPDWWEKKYLWYDKSHPYVSLVEDLLVGWIRKIKRATAHDIKTMLIVGDSTTAFCFERKKAIDVEVLARLTRRVAYRTGLDMVLFKSVVGTYFTDSECFSDQIRQATQNNERYDAVFLVGGWNQAYYDPKGFTDDVVNNFHNLALRAQQ